MSALMLRTGVVALFMASAGVALAEDIELALLQCAPREPVTTVTIVRPECRIRDNNDLVRIEDCTCPENFDLVRLTTPAAIITDFSPI